MGKQRFTGPPPRIIGRGLQQYLVELQDWLYKLWQSLAVIVTQGFEDVPPEDVNITTAAGTEELGWAAADHQHRLGIVSEQGDLITHDGQDPVALEVGPTPGEVLTVDPTEPAGISWKPASGSASLFDGLIAFWKMDEATGLLRRDSMGRHDLIPFGAPPLVTGKLDGAAEFGASSALYYPDPDADSALNPGLGDLSIAAWIYVSSLTNSFYIVCKQAIASPPYSEGYNFRVTTTGFLFATLGNVSASVRGGQYLTDAAISLNTWHHVVMVIDRTVAGKFYVYLDGVLAAPQVGQFDDVDHFDDTSGDISTDAPFGVNAQTFSPTTSADVDGLANPSTWGEGRTDMMGVWGRTITAAEVSALYAGGLGRNLEPPCCGPSTITPPIIEADQDDYYPGRAGVYWLSADAPWNITGFVQGIDGDLRRLVNVGDEVITLTHQDAASLAGNRFTCPADTDIALDPGDMAVALYDAAFGTWRLFEQAGGTIPAGTPWNNNYWGPPLSFYFG